MTEWAYKTTAAKLGHSETAVLSCNRGFLARARHKADGTKLALIDLVSLGDTIHLYYPLKTKVAAIGAFEVTTPYGRYALSYGGLVSGTGALYEIDNDAFVFEIDKKRVFEPDPVIGKITGWCVRRTGAARKYDPDLFLGFRPTLARVAGT